MSNIVLTGFMGTGKSTVGQDVAQQLGRPFVDMDAEIESRAGKPIARIFAEDGEPAFRRMEASLCAELSGQRALVIATGGGTLIEDANRALMMHSGSVICLNCDPDRLLHRLSSSQRSQRPLLSVREPRKRLVELLNVRRTAYTAIPWQIDTTDLTPHEVADRVIELSRSISLTVRHPGGEYEVKAGRGLLAHVGGLLLAAGAPEDSIVAVVANPVVEDLYGHEIVEKLAGSGLQPVACSIPDGEQFKNLATVSALYGQFVVAGLDRRSTVLALGGGVTTDLAGYAAATYLRGVRLVHVPTSLLAMVDACVGGKTGVDLECGKNLVGAFKQPVLAVLDPCVLSTLPSPELRSGIAELIKQALIGDAELFADLERAQPTAPIRPEWLARALKVKARIVEEDPFEQGRRAVLNLGHTVGHALEVLSGFRLRHGDAVSAGMVAATRISVEMGMANASLVSRIQGMLASWRLPVRCPGYKVDAIWAAMMYDKKRRARSLRWVLPREVGTVEIVDEVPSELVRAVLCAMGARATL